MEVGRCVLNALIHLEKAEETLSNQSQERNNRKVISMLENLKQKLQKKKETRVVALATTRFSFPTSFDYTNATSS
jgi:hypothetical protein